MPVKLPKELTTDVIWKPIKLSEGSVLELCLKRPDFKDQVASLATRSVADQYRMRVTRTVVDWRGVEDFSDPPQPVPYSADALLQLITTYPQSLHQIDRALTELWYVLPEDLEKNWPTPPANGGTTTNGETASMTIS